MTRMDELLSEKSCTWSNDTVPVLRIRIVIATSSPSYTGPGRASIVTFAAGLPGSTDIVRLVSSAYVGCIRCCFVACRRLPLRASDCSYGKNLLKLKCTDFKVYLPEIEIVIGIIRVCDSYGSISTSSMGSLVISSVPFRLTRISESVNREFSGFAAVTSMWKTPRWSAMAGG